MKKFLATLAMLFALAAHAAVDVNKGTAADLDGIKGIGPAMSQRILDARKQGEFKNWDDLLARVKGVKAKTAAKLSAAGLTVNGQAFKEGTTTAANTSAHSPAKDSAGPAKASAR